MHNSSEFYFIFLFCSTGAHFLVEAVFVSEAQILWSSWVRSWIYGSSSTVWNTHVCGCPSSVDISRWKQSPGAATADESQIVGWKLLIFMLIYQRYKDIYRHESGRHSTLLPLLINFFIISLNRISFYIKVIISCPSNTLVPI